MNNESENEMNDHWKVLSGGGVVVSNTAEQLWENATKYFKWCEDNPIKTKKPLTSGKTQGQSFTVEYNRPFTVEGLCLHCGISKQYINSILETHDKSSDFRIVIERIMYVIYSQNLEGAIVDLYNPVIVSKILKIDKEQETSSQSIKVEIVRTEKPKLANSEDEVLSRLDFDKLMDLKEKADDKQ